MLNNTGGLWFGWSGKIVERRRAAGEGELHIQQAGPVKLVTLDLSREDHDAYYLGYSNGVLWPVFHYRLDLADFDAGYIAGYRRVNQLFARKLLPLLRADDIIWVHDYHLIPLAAELRALGCNQRIGFFLHIPLPPPLILAAIPRPRLADPRRCSPTTWWASRARPTCSTSAATSQTEAHAQDAGRRPLARLRPHGAGRRLPDRHRRGGVHGARRTRRRRARCTSACGASTRAASCWWAWTGSTTRRACRSACAPSASCWRNYPETAQQRDADPDRLAQPRGRQRLQRHPARAGKPVRLHQRQLRRTRLDAGALHAPHGGARARCRACTAPAAWRWSRRCATA